MKWPGVTYYSKANHVASDLLPDNEDGTHSLYNLQFERDGYFVANGLTVESIPVLSHIAPLPKELFFDKDLYNKPSKNKLVALDSTILESN